MPRTKTPFPDSWNIADLITHLGDIDPQRIRLQPAPGTATEKDVVRLEERENRLFELIEGVLVEKVMGARESLLNMWLGHLLQSFLDAHSLGVLFGADGTLKITPDLVRIPDLSFVSWDQIPDRKIPEEPIPDLYPDLAVEVLSKGNTKGEMQRKLKEYFLAGTQLVWFVDPKQRTVQVFTAPDQSIMLTDNDTLDGNPVLPGLQLTVRDIFAKLDGPSPNNGKRSRRKKS